MTLISFPVSLPYFGSYNMNISASEWCFEQISGYCGSSLMRREYTTHFQLAYRSWASSCGNSYSMLYIQLSKLEHTPHSGLERDAHTHNACWQVSFPACLPLTPKQCESCAYWANISIAALNAGLVNQSCDLMHISGGKHRQPKCTYDSHVAAYHTRPMSSVCVSFVPATLSI